MAPSRSRSVLPRVRWDHHSALHPRRIVPASSFPSALDAALRASVTHRALALAVRGSFSGAYYSACFSESFALALPSGDAIAFAIAWAS